MKLHTIGVLVAVVAFTAGVPVKAALPSATTPAIFGGCSAIAPLAEAFLARHIDPLALAPIEHPPLDVAVAPPDVMASAETADHRLEYPEGTKPSPRPRPSAAPTQTAEVVPAEVKLPKGADAILAAVQAYQRFRSGVFAIAKLRFDTPDGIRQAQRLLASQNQVNLSRGWLAACSQIATKVSAFLAGITSASKDSPDAFTTKMEQTPGEVLKVDGWQAASAAVLKQVASDIAQMETVAYRLVDVSEGNEAQRAAAAAGGNYGALPNPSAESATQAEGKKSAITQIAEVGVRMRAAQASAQSEPAAKAKPLMTQVLAFGARMQLAQKGAMPDPQGASYADNDQCLRWAQLNLNQCLAAAHDNTERAWCLGNHGIHDRVKCWSVIVDGGT